MLQNLHEPTVRPHLGTRPMALLVLAFGVATGGSLAEAPALAIDPPAPSSAAVRGESDVTVVRKPVRVIPLPVRDDPAR